MAEWFGFCPHFAVLHCGSERLASGLKTRFSHSERGLSVRRKSTARNRRDRSCVRASLSWEARFQVGGGVMSCPSHTEPSRCAATPAANLSKHDNHRLSPL